MRNVSVFVVGMLCVLCWSDLCMASGSHDIIGTTTNAHGDLTRTELTIQVDDNPLSRFKMTRLVLDVPTEDLRGSIILLPTISTTFYGFYEMNDPKRKNAKSFAEFFAYHNYDVYGYTPRLQGIPSGMCETGALDCSVMADWDIQSMVEDVTYIRSQVEIFHPGSKVAVGGISFGGILAIAVVNAHPNDYDGVFPWEGILISNDLDVQDMNHGYCNELIAMHDAGIYYNGIGGNVIKDVAYFSSTDPSGLTPISFFPLLTNHQVLVLNLTQPAPGPGSQLVPNFMLMNGSISEDRLFYAKESRFYENIRSHSGYMTYPPARDAHCSIAGLDNQHTANLGSYTGSVLMIGGGMGYGAYMQDQYDAFGSDDKTLLIEPDFGHVDHFMVPNHREYAEKPIHRWLKRVFKD